jgi:serine protease Do
MSRQMKIRKGRFTTGLLLLAGGFLAGLLISGNVNSTRDVLSPATAIAAPENQLRSYADVAEIAMPGVVNISTDKVVELPNSHPLLEDPFFRRFFGEPETESRERVERSLGSGVIISDDGYILTSNHVIERGTKIRVLLGDESEYEAEIVGQDAATDVALIKIDGRNLPYVRIGNSDALRIGDQVMAIGNPFGVGQTVTTGIVSAKGRSINLINYEDFIQTDASINPGNSGGALVNMAGELIGINTAILSRSGGSQGVGFAIPTSMATVIMDMLKKDGEVKRAWLGVIPAEVDQTMAQALGMDRPRGVLMSVVNEDTPAEEAGILEGDIILEVDGETINSTSRLRNKISLLGIGHDAKLLVLRDGKEKRITVKLGELPAAGTTTQNENDEQESDEGLDGVIVRTVVDRHRTHMELDEDVTGVIVSSIAQTSNAYNRGLRQGDIIVEVGRENIKDIDDYKAQVNKDKDRPVLLRVLRRGGYVMIAVPR